MFPFQMSGLQAPLHNTTSEKTWNLSNTTVRTSCHAQIIACLFLWPDSIHCGYVNLLEGLKPNEMIFVENLQWWKERKLVYQPDSCTKNRFIIFIIIVSFIQGIHSHISETNHVPREYIVAAIRSLLFMVPLFLVPALALLFFYVSTFQSMCAVPNMAVFCSSLYWTNMYFSGMASLRVFKPPTFWIFWSEENSNYHSFV